MGMNFISFRASKFRLERPEFRLNEISVLSISFYSVLAAEDLAESLRCGLADGLLDMEVMPGHIQIGMADDGLDRGQINAHGLHLGYISMAAAMGCQQPHAGNLLQSRPELVPEVAGIAGVARFPGLLPDVGTALLPQLHRTPA